jgi:hypothetical protein
MCILGNLALDIGASACRIMQSRAFSKPDQIKTTSFRLSGKKIVQNLHIMEKALQMSQRIECSGHTGLFSHLTTFHSDLWTKLNYEGEIWIQQNHSVLKIFTMEGSHSKSWFKSGGSELRIWILATKMSIQWHCSGPEKWNRDQRVSAVPEIFTIQAWEGLGW